MTHDEEQDQIEIQKAEQFIAETPQIEGVETVHVRLDRDWSGDPAMYLIFTLRKSLDADKEWIHRFIDYSSAIQQKIIDSGLTRFPYTQLDRAA